MMDLEKAKATLKDRLDEYEGRIKRNPENYKQWIDQMYGFMLGIENAVDGLYEWVNENDIWTEWYMRNHPAYK